jgi:hypothetical protein
MSTNQLNKLNAILSYMESIDRNGSWNEVIKSINEHETTLLFELETLELTLVEWIEEEKSGGVDTLATTEILKAVKRMIREELAK